MILFLMCSLQRWNLDAIKSNFILINNGVHMGPYPSQRCQTRNENYTSPIPEGVWNPTWRIDHDHKSTMWKMACFPTKLIYFRGKKKLTSCEKLVMSIGFFLEYYKLQPCLHEPNVIIAPVIRALIEIKRYFKKGCFFKRSSNCTTPSYGQMALALPVHCNEGVFEAMG